ncbi:MAG: hypothetical protein ACXWLB_03860 [Reyranella sp.]
MNRRRRRGARLARARRHLKQQVVLFGERTSDIYRQSQRLCGAGRRSPDHAHPDIEDVVVIAAADRAVVAKIKRRRRGNGAVLAEKPIMAASRSGVAP